MSVPPASHSILRLKEKDAAELAAFENECFSSPWTEEQYGKLLREIERLEEADSGEKPAWAVWGMRERDGKLVAYVSIGIYYRTAELEVFNIAVRKDRRRLGLGRELLLHALGWAAANGFERALLEVRENNLAARRLYASAFFQQAGRRKRYYADTGEDALVLACDLSAFSGRG